MKKLMSVFILFLSTLSISAQQFSYSNESNTKNYKNSAIMVMPIESINEIENGLYGLVFEAQTATTKNYGYKVTEKLLFGNNEFESRINIGVQWNILGFVLEGINVGIYPGLYVENKNSKTNISPSLIVDASLNTIISKNIIFGLCAGYDIVTTNITFLGAKVGFSFENKNIKIVNE